MTVSKKIAFIGIGLMGLPMAKHLLAAGHQLVAWNRTATKAAALTDRGGVVAETPDQAVHEADFIITMLSDGAAVDAILAGPELRAALRRGSLWIDMSSTQPTQARAQSARLDELGIAHLDAPVSGGTKGAEAASLAIMVGGQEEAFSAALPVLSVLGRPVHVGPSGSGQLAKLANQAIVAVTIGAVAEAMLLLDKGGADPAAVRDALRGGFADSTILQQHGTRMTTNNFVPGGLSKLQLKDLNNVLSEANELNLSLPVTQHIRDRFDHFVHQMDGAELDHAGLYLELQSRNGDG
jgi:3-hydroxyisobutyrate dehydrogenase-like beta-hydroxyacid dehydrogenase